MSVATLNSERPVAPVNVDKGTRFLFLDGLRGLAALSVAMGHLYFLTDLAGPLKRLGPEWLSSIALHYGLGVQVFFVLSGFVIAYSVRNDVIDLRFVGSFALRRSLRLDPPYWTVLGLILLVNALTHWYVEGRFVTSYRTSQFLINAAYLPALLSQPYMLWVAWTLCLEVQFYIVFILVLSAVQRGGLGIRSRRGALLFGMLAVLSLIVAVERAGRPRHGLFIEQWYMFFLGVLLCWTVTAGLRSLWFWLYAAMVLLLAIRVQADGPIVAVLTAVSIWLAFRMGSASSWLGGPVIQFLGRISYSLYLIHGVIGVVIANYLGGFVSHDGIAVVWLIVAMGGSIASAYVLYVLVERPGIELGRYLNRRRKVRQS